MGGVSECCRYLIKCWNTGSSLLNAVVIICPHNWRFSGCNWTLLNNLIEVPFPMEGWTRWSVKFPSNLSCSYSYEIDSFYKICVGLGLMLTIFRCRCFSESSEEFVFTAGGRSFTLSKNTVLKYDLSFFFTDKLSESTVIYDQ